MNIGFALIPEKEFIKNLAQYQNEIADKYNLKPKLGLENNLPHVTLIQGTFKDDFDYSHYIDVLRKNILDSNFDMQIQFDEVRYEDVGWYFLMLKDNQHIQQVHQNLFVKINKFMCSKYDTSDNKVIHLNDRQKQYYLKYSYRYLLEEYIPHITLFRDNYMNIDDFLFELDNDMQSFYEISIEIERLTVYKMGEDGVHAETLIEMTI